MQKMALTVQELIDKLSQVENKELEVWIRGNDLKIIPCDEMSECSGDGDYLVLSNHREINMDEIIKSLGIKTNR